MENEGYDRIKVRVTDPVVGVHFGELLLRTHSRSQCERRDIACCVHFPSGHHMRDWPMTWRSDTRVMERDCPHGVGHPDPDHLAYVRSLTPEHDCVDDHELTADYRIECPYPHLEWQGVHGCDGCCRA